MLEKWQNINPTADNTIDVKDKKIRPKYVVYYLFTSDGPLSAILPPGHCVRADSAVRQLLEKVEIRIIHS